MPLSSYALIAANLIPLIGVVFFQWDSALVLALFWIENLIIGAFNVLRMWGVSVVAKNISGLFSSAFFLVHYGLFCAVHGMLLTDLLDYPKVNVGDYFTQTSTGFLGIFQDGAAVFLSFVDMFSPTILIGIAGLVLSHFSSFIENFILRGEIFKLKARQLMAEPYSHIIVMHAGLIVGAIVLQKLHSPVWLLATIILLKLMADFALHKRRHVVSKHTELIKDL